MVSLRVAIGGPARRAELRSGYACAAFRPPPRRRRGLLPGARVLMGMPQTLEPPLPRAAPTATEEAFLYIFKPQKCQTFRGRRQVGIQNKRNEIGDREAGNVGRQKLPLTLPS